MHGVLRNGEGIRQILPLYFDSSDDVRIIH